MLENYQQERKEFLINDIKEIMETYLEKFELLDTLFQSIYYDKKVKISSFSHPKFSVVANFLRLIEGKFTEYRMQSTVSNFEMNVIISEQKKFVHTLQIEYSKLLKSSNQESYDILTSIGLQIGPLLEEAFLLLKPYVQSQNKITFDHKLLFYPALASKIHPKSIVQL